MAEKHEALGEDVHPHAVRLDLPQLLEQLPGAALVLDRGDDAGAGRVSGLTLHSELEQRIRLLREEPGKSVGDDVGDISAEPRV